MFLIVLVAFCSVSFGADLDELQMIFCVDKKTQEGKTMNKCYEKECEQVYKELATRICEMIKEKSGKRIWFNDNLNSN